ncbi:unnamed protein product [Mytilus coruscus]|uniref:DNA/RNA non-specific endonuclease domain-containing protein n=1 Tax=Mytilus coruscus TaxID=42192 RepID=A0A6J8DKU0_MYTCO|nr:unnamed protein product [Mytilus coruscus]
MGCITVSLLLYTLIVFSKEVQVTISDLVDPESNDECLREFFYKGVPPIYMNTGGESDKFICQKYKGKKYFFTRYSTRHKIPIYSAYKIEFDNKIISNKRPSWRIEKQLNSNQTKNKDYLNSGFQKGHLNPKYHNQNISENRIKATFTLTNAVPMTGEANNEWFQVAEKPLFYKMRIYCSFPDATRYIIVGVIPAFTKNERNINIPNYIWSAAYCDTNSSKIDNWSFGYLMDTHTTFHAKGAITGLQQKLTDLTGSRVEIFNTTNSNQEDSPFDLQKRPRKPIINVCPKPKRKRHRPELVNNCK